MENRRKKFEALGNEMKDLTGESSKARGLIGNVGIRRIQKLISEPGGLLESIRAGKVIMIPTDRGSEAESERATQDLNRLFKEIETCCDLMGKDGKGEKSR